MTGALKGTVTAGGEPAPREEPLHVVLFEPEIPPNTGNVARLCAGLGVALHLVGRLGFQLSDRHLKRAGLDYWPYVRVLLHPDLERFLQERDPEKLYFFSSRGGTTYLKARFRRGSWLVFGSESRGLPEWVFRRYRNRFWTIPIFRPEVRSLNLSNAVAVGVYEALRQIGDLGTAI